MSQLQVDILSPAKIVTKTKANQVQLPGINGYMGILPGHTAFVSELGIGELELDATTGKELFFVSGGYVEVSEDNVRVLVDVCERLKDIDIDRAESAKKRAQDRLQKKIEVDMMRAQAALMRADGRLELAQKH